MTNVTKANDKVWTDDTCKASSVYYLRFAIVRAWVYFSRTKILNGNKQLQ